MESQGKAKVALTFALYQGDQLVRRDTIAQDIVKVGKDPRSHLRVDDELASRMHAVIEVGSPGDITLIDLGNEPGTLVNGQRVNKCKIRPGDQIQIGSTLIVLEEAELATSVDTQAVPAAPSSPAPAANPFAGSNPFAAAPAAANPFAGANLFAGQSAPAAPSSGAAGFAPAAGYATGSGHTPGLGIEPPMDPGPPGSFTYSMLKSGPDVSPDEVEVAHVSAIEVMIMWDANVLFVSHLSPPRSFYVGEEVGEKSRCDYFIPSETLGTTRAPIVVARGLGAALVILPRSRGYVDIPGQGNVTLSDLVSTGRARPSSEMSGAFEYELPAGAKARKKSKQS